MWGTGFFKGLAVTMRNMFRGPVTLQYPDEKQALSDRARWAVKPLYDEGGSLLCTACGNCVRACPDGVLVLDSVTDEEKNKRILFLDYEVGACMFCGLCVEACPFSALEMSLEYELATVDTAELVTRLLEDVDAASAKRARKGGEAQDD
jgi:NADH-quinone oxidoreductase subunit I